MGYIEFANVKIVYPDRLSLFSAAILVSGIQPGERLTLQRKITSDVDGDSSYYNDTFYAPEDAETGDTFTRSIGTSLGPVSDSYTITEAADAEVRPRTGRNGFRFPTSLLSNEQILGSDLTDQQRRAFREGIGLSPEPTPEPEPAAPEPNTSDLSASSQLPTPNDMSAFSTVAAIVGAVVLAIAVIGN